MSKLLKVAGIYVILHIVGFLITSCDPWVEYHCIEGITVISRRIIGFSTAPGGVVFNVEEANYMNDTLSIRYDSLGFDILFSIGYYSEVLNDGNFFMNSCYGFQPSIVYEKVKDINIFSDNGYNSFLPAGANLTEIMNVRYEYKIVGEDVASFIPKYDCSRYSQAFFMFSLAPDDSKVHNLTFRFTTETGNTVETIVQNLKITK